MPLGAPSGGTLHYRLVGVPPGESFTPGTADPLSDDLFYVTSKYRADHPWIEAPPEGDGQSVDWLTGRIEDGSYTVSVIDVPDTCTLGSVVTDEQLDATTMFVDGWTIHGDTQGLGYTNTVPASSSPTAFGGWWSDSGGGLFLGGSVLFFWVDEPAGPQYEFPPHVRETWAEKTYSGFIPGERVGARFQANNTLSTGPGNVFLEIEGQSGATRVSFPDGNITYFNIDSALSGDVQDGFLATNADANGEVIVRLGGENFAPSCNFACEFTRVQLARCLSGTGSDGSGPSSASTRYVTRWLADDFARQQMIGWQFYIETSTDNGTTWSDVLYAGYLTRLELPEALVYVFTIGDTRRVERITPAWRNVDPLNNTADLRMTALPPMGGPVHRGWAPHVFDYGLPIYEVENQQAASASNVADGWVMLRYKSGGYFAQFTAPNFPTGENMQEAANLASAPFFSPAPPPSVSGTSTWGTYPGLRGTLLAVGSDTPDAVLSDLTPIGVMLVFGVGEFDYGLMSFSQQVILQWAVTSTGTYPNGTQLRLLIVPREISEAWPMHYTGHPVDLVTGLHDKHGLAYDSASAVSVKAALGDDLSVMLRFTDPEQKLQDLLEALYGRFGFAIRIDTTGTREFFLFRQKGDSAPTLSLSASDLTAEGGPTYELDDGGKCNRVVLRSQLFRQRNKNDPPPTTWDTVVTHDSELTFDYSTDGGATIDADGSGAAEAVYELPGHVAWADDNGAMNLPQTGDGLARTIFEHNGRGVQMATWPTLRSGDGQDAQLGDVVSVGVAHNPNAQVGQTPTSQRGGTRRMRVMQRTEGESGPLLRLEDEDTGVQYTGSFSLALDDDAVDPLHFRELSITGADDLNTDKAWLEVEVQLAATTPSASEHGVLYTVLDGQEMPAEPHTLRIGPFPQGSHVWVRGRAFLPGGARGDWTSWTNTGVSVPGITGSISSLSTGTPVAGGTTLTWTNTNTTHRVKVELKPDAGSTYSLLAVLGAGSTSYTIVGLLPSTDYDVRVILIDAITGQEAGSALTGSFTTAASGTQTTLTTPTNAAVFGGYDPLTLLADPGLYGLQVTAVFGPSHQSIQFEVAVETSVGSGTPGTYSTLTILPANTSGVTRATDRAANDGKVRYLKAKAIANGYNDSSYTTALSVNPWATTPTVPTDPNSGLPVGITPGAVPGWTGTSWVPSLFVTDSSGDPLSDSVGDLLLVEDT